jgi:hypothetical protein
LIADISVVPAFCPRRITGRFAGVIFDGSGQSATGIVPKLSSKRPLLDASIGPPFSTAAVSPNRKWICPWCS